MVAWVRSLVHVEEVILWIIPIVVLAYFEMPARRSLLMIVVFIVILVVII